MSKRIPKDQPIPSLDTPWDDGRNAYTGQRVEEFVKNQFRDLQTANGLKFGDAAFDGQNIVFYDTEGGTVLLTMPLGGTSYIINIGADRPQSFYVLTSQEEAIINITPTTQQATLGSTDREDYLENYTYIVEVDNGNGFIDRTPSSPNIIGGGSASIDIRRYITTGANRVRVIVTGASSGQTKTTVFSVTLTSLNLSVDHSWHKAWIQGEGYAITGIFFSGNIAKRLFVKVGGRTYWQDFSATSQYTSVAYTFDLTDKFPAEGSGVYDVEVWMEGGDVQTRVYRYRIMCVAATDRVTAQLICINKAQEKAVNYSSQTLMQYATYNLTSVTLDIEAHLGGTTQSIVSGQEMAVQTQTRCDYTTTLQIDTDLTDALSLDIALRGGTAEESLSMPIDNSHAYIATADASFYLNPGIRSNNRADRAEIHNTAPSAAVASYAARWENFTFADDAWTTDPDGHKCLAVLAGCSLDIRTDDPNAAKLKPLDISGTSSVSVEWMYRADNIADYDTPVFSIMSTEEFNANETRGIVLFPTRLLVFDSDSRNNVYQKLDLPEGRIIHVTVVLQRNYNNAGRNLCRVYINGRENLTYEYTGSHAQPDGGYGFVRMGQASTDFYLYMMRCYPLALQPANALANYINALIDTAEVSKAGEKADNDIVDGTVISYEMCRKAGFNCMVIESEADVPSLANPEVSTKVNLRLEYNDHPEWNVIIRNIPIAGQGTTSMMYAKWNLTHKIKDPAVWEYPNYKVDGVAVTETSTEGYIAGYGLHPKVSKITSKKNIASSPQGHKMGATAFYHELFVECEGTDMLPSANCRTATYQYPFMGFRKSEAGYEFIGLYTVGPDKKDLKTFGYNETVSFPSLMMIEGPNHAPLMTRFLVPWTDDVHYNYQEETLTLGSGVNTDEGWDADIVSNYKTDKADYAERVMNLYLSEFKPAYDAIFFTSPYIASLTEAGFNSLEQLNENASSYRGSGTTRGHANSLMTLYDPSDYTLIYYDYATQQYKRLSGHDMLAYLGLSGTPTTDEIVQARAAKFVSEDSGVFRYVSKSEALFHECFCELLGVSDNFAKNTYWRKFKAVGEGGKWGFNEDDLDTLFANDNNGQDTKSYSVEPDDVNGTGQEIFQGANSAFWYQLRQCCQAEIRQKMAQIVEKCGTLAAKYNCAANTKHGSVINLIRHYFWAHSAKYFPATAYNEDTIFGYINVWAQNPGASYNGVKPLTQVHGDHYETELAWVERRVAYIFSKYKIGDWDGQSNDGAGTLDFTLAEQFDMNVTPAIDLYPAYSVGGAPVSGSARVSAGDEHTFVMPPGAATNIYVKAMDWLSDLGDLSGMKLGTRGGDEANIEFSVAGKRLRRLVVGNADPEQVVFNATRLSVSGESIEEIYARNVATLRGNIDLDNCPRLRRADFYGTNISQVMLPVGGRVNEAHMPATLTTLFLHSLNLLEADSLYIPDEAYGNIENLYFNGCTRINPVQFINTVLGGENHLKFITLIWDDEIEIDSDEFDKLVSLVENPYDKGTGLGVGALQYENGRLTPDPNRTAPVLQGKLYMPNPVYADTVEKVKTLIGNTLQLRCNENMLYMRFADMGVNNVMKTRYGDGTGTFLTQIEAVTTLPPNIFENAAIETFNELELFTSLTSIGDKAFKDSTLKSISFPASLRSIANSSFDNCVSLERLNAPSLEMWLNLNVGNSGLTTYAQNLYICGELLEDLVVPEGFATLRQRAFMALTCLKSVVIPEGVTTIGAYAFSGCSSIRRIDMPLSLQSIGTDAFYNTDNVDIYVPDLSAWCAVPKPYHIAAYQYNSRVHINGNPQTAVLSGIESIGAEAATALFMPDSELVIAGDVKTIGKNAFRNSKIRKVTICEGVETIGERAFQASVIDEVVIADSVTTMGANAFDNTTDNYTANIGLKRVTVGSGVTSLPGGVFNYCRLERLIMRPEIPPTMGYRAIWGTDDNFTIYVPNNSVEYIDGDVNRPGYKRASGWSGYASRIHPMTELYPAANPEGLVAADAHIATGTSTTIPYRLLDPIAVMPIIDTETQERIAAEAYTIEAELAPIAGVTLTAQDNTGFTLTTDTDTEGHTANITVTLKNSYGEAMWSREVSLVVGQADL